jgi:subtilisin
MDASRRTMGMTLVVVIALVLSSLSAASALAATSAVPASYIFSVVEGADPLVVAEDNGARAAHVYDTVMNGFAADVSDSVLSRLQRDTRVEDITVDGTMRLAAKKDTTIPAGHPAQFTSWGQDRIGLLSSKTAKVDGKDERVDVDVAVLDSGVAPHPDLNIAGGVDCSGSISKTYGDDDGHGTLVAGFIGAIDNSFGVVGMAPGARIWAVRVVKANGIVTDSAAICGLEWVRDNAHVIEVANLSFGENRTVGGNCGETRQGFRPDPTHRAICEVVNAGVVVVASAGNEGIDAGRHVPSSYPEVVAVSAFTETDGRAGGFGPPANCLPGEYDDHLATFSNYGATIALAAPGVCVTSTHLNNAYARSSGTSFSAPHVAGAAALIRARNPRATPAQVREALIAASERAALFGDPDGIAEPIVNVAKL